MVFKWVGSHQFSLPKVEQAQHGASEYADMPEGSYSVHTWWNTLHEASRNIMMISEYSSTIILHLDNSVLVR